MARLIYHRSLKDSDCKNGSTSKNKKKDISVMKTNVTKDITEIHDEVRKLETDTINIIEQKQ